MSSKYRLAKLERHQGKNVPAGCLPIVFDEEPTRECPHAADGLAREVGETLEQWVARYQNTTGRRALVFRRDGEMLAYSDAKGWHDGMDLFV